MNSNSLFLNDTMSIRHNNYKYMTFMKYVANKSKQGIRKSPPLPLQKIYISKVNLSYGKTLFNVFSKIIL